MSLWHSNEEEPVQDVEILIESIRGFHEVVYFNKFESGCVYFQGEGVMKEPKEIKHWAYIKDIENLE